MLAGSSRTMATTVEAGARQVFRQMAAKRRMSAVASAAEVKKLGVIGAGQMVRGFLTRLIACD